MLPYDISRIHCSPSINAKLPNLSKNTKYKA